MSIKEDDLLKYPCFLFKYGTIWPVPKLENWGNDYQLHHFVRQSIRKNNPEFYKRVEYLQKLILMPAKCNYDLECMGEETFLKRYGVHKNDLVFSRKKWREGYYDRADK